MATVYLDHPSQDPVRLAPTRPLEVLPAAQGEHTLADTDLGDLGEILTGHQQPCQHLAHQVKDELWRLGRAQLALDEIQGQLPTGRAGRR